MVGTWESLLSVISLVLKTKRYVYLTLVIEKGEDKEKDMLTVSKAKAKSNCSHHFNWLIKNLRTDRRGQVWLNKS